MTNKIVNERLSEEELQLVSQLRKRKHLAKEGEAVVTALLDPEARRVLARKLWLANPHRPAVADCITSIVMYVQYKYENLSAEDVVKLSREKATHTLIEILENAVAEQGILILLEKPI
jgi:hypothetical protein